MWDDDILQLSVMLQKMIQKTNMIDVVMIALNQFPPLAQSQLKLGHPLKMVNKPPSAKGQGLTRHL